MSNLMILKHRTVYNLIQFENDGVYKGLCWVSRNKKTEHDLVYGINNITLGGEIGICTVELWLIIESML